MSAKHTPGPWRWEVNETSKCVSLCGGRPRYDLTVMDFERWGMGSAIPRFRDNEDRGILARCLSWAQPEPGREHHAHWFKTLKHPDACLIEAAPDLLEALEALLSERGWNGEVTECERKARAAIAKAKGGQS